MPVTRLAKRRLSRISRSISFALVFAKLSTPQWLKARLNPIGLRGGAPTAQRRAFRNRLSRCGRSRPWRKVGTVGRMRARASLLRLERGAFDLDPSGEPLDRDCLVLQRQINQRLAASVNRLKDGANRRSIAASGSVIVVLPVVISGTIVLSQPSPLGRSGTVGGREGRRTQNCTICFTSAFQAP